MCVCPDEGVNETGGRESCLCVCDGAAILGNELLYLDKRRQGEMYLHGGWGGVGGGSEMRAEWGS